MTNEHGRHEVRAIGRIHNMRPLIDPESARRMIDAMSKFGAAYAKRINEAVIPALKQFDAAMWRAYRAAGAPYGDTAEGRQRWVEQESRKLRATREAEYQAMRDIPLRLPPKRRGP